MDLMDINPEEDYQEQCGSIYLTSSGSLIIHCTLCENKFVGYEDYTTHIEDHIAPDLFVNEADVYESYEYDEIILPERNCENNTIFVPESDTEELTLDESEDILSVEFERASQVKSEGDESNCESYIEVERLEGEVNIDSTNTTEMPIKVKSEVSSNAANLKYARALQRRLNCQPKGRSHKCPYCDFSCNDRSNLLGHIKRHSNHKPHKCSECEKSFYTRTELKAHTRSHTGERPYLCTECGKAFGTSSKLTLHLKRHANLRDKECPMCDMKFFSSTRLRDHMTIHSEDRPLKCDFCEASFKSYSSLKNHRKLHENERKYKCTLCSASFNQNPGLYSHMKKRHSVVRTVDALEHEIKEEIEEP